MISPGPLAEWNADSSELSQALTKRRTRIETHATTFESAPAQSVADATHLDGISFTAPPMKEWLQTLPGAPEEDRVAELLAAGVENRGPLPAHAPAAAAQEDEERLRTLSASLDELRRRLEAEQAQLGAKHGELAHREAEVKAQEKALEQQREVERCRQRALQEYPRPKWLEKIEGTINIGVVGNSGVGKSLLINRLRGVFPDSPAWAPVGVNETTFTVAMYAFPNDQRVRLLDFPGAGTAAFPLDTYIQRMGLRYLDHVIIATAGRFTETELALQKELEQHSVPYCMVRTKADIDVWNNQQDNGKSQAQTVAEIVGDLKARGVARPYVVSLRDTSSYDFQDLVHHALPFLRQELLGPSMGAGWDDAWALPQVYSPVVSLLQGRWSDHQSTSYFVQGLQVHVQKQEGDSGVLVLTEDEAGKVWWMGRLWIDASSVARARTTGELRWANKWDKSALKPMVWRWAD